MQVFQATPTPRQQGLTIQNKEAGQFSLQVNFDQQQSNQSPERINIELILNQLSKEQQSKFLSQFAKLNSEQQTYAYNQFLSTPPEVQEFALNQFLSLDPEVLILSIQTELDSEPSAGGQAQQSNHQQTQPPLFQPQRSSPLTQIDQTRFQTNFSPSASQLARKSNGVKNKPQLNRSAKKNAKNDFFSDSANQFPFLAFNQIDRNSAF